MSYLVFLGTSNAVPDPTHENTHMALSTGEGVILIDCAGSPNVRLSKVGIGINAITDLILTHFHPDHVSGVPILLMNMWLLGRDAPLRIYGLHHCLERIEDVMALYHWDKWPGFFPVAFHRLPERENIQVLEISELKITSSPVRHLIPTIGLRIESKVGTRKIAYSCDTEPCPSVVRLAKEVDILIHEATGFGAGHSSASQAGAIASEAKVKRLLLIHYPVVNQDPERLIVQAKETFDGDVELAQDFMKIPL
jgi:ribonuclease Z